MATDKKNKIAQAERIEVMRSEINFAPYNPRRISDEARKKLKANLKKVGIMGGIVWNKTTGNLVSGHQKVAICDEVNHYNQETHENDYALFVEVVELNEKEEKEQNLFMNNRSVQGEFDDELLKQMLSEIDYEQAGFTAFDISIYGIGIDNYQAETPKPVQDWSVDSLTENDERLARINESTKQAEENTKINRSVDFYQDTPENQVARHNEIQKVKDRIVDSDRALNDNGVLSYVTLSFKSPDEKVAFMEDWGYDPMDKFIDADDFLHKLEFGTE